MDRRTAIHRISLLLGAALSSSTASGLLAGCCTPSVPYQPRTLSAAAYRFVGDLAETILPETDTPGARGAGVHRFIDAMLTDYYSESDRDVFLGDLATWMTSLDPTDFDAVAAMDHAAFKTRDASFIRLKELVISGYYMSEVGATQELHQMPMGIYRSDAPVDEIGRTWA